ncbi:MAG: class I adenylate-forming enzyme family protein [Candidatus Helarchaeota archaeon]
MAKSPFKKMFDIKANYYPKDRLSIVYGKKHLTWKEEQARINKLAYMLKKKYKVIKGDKVAVLMHNRPEFVEANLALQTLGAIPVPVNYRYVASELEFLLNNCDAIGIIFEESATDIVMGAKPSSPNVRFYICVGETIPEGMDKYDGVLAAGKNKDIKVNVDPDDVAVIIYTGGTTGRPKGVMLTYENMLVNQEATIKLLVTFLPSVDDIDYPKYARSKGEAKLMNVLNLLIGQMYQNLFKGPEDRKILVFDIGTKTGVDIPPMTIRQVEEKVKIFNGKPEKYDVLFRGSIFDQMRDFINLLPKSYSKKGKLSLLPTLIWKFLLGGVKLEGSFGDRMAMINSLMAKPDDDSLQRMLLTPPMFHLAAYALWTFNWLISGALIVIPESESFVPQEIIELSNRENITWTFFVPTQWKRIIKYLEKEHPDFKLDSLKVAFSGAALLRAKVKKQILKYFPEVLIIDVFGQTEMAPAASVKIDGDESSLRDRSVGQVVPNIEIKIVDENGNEVPEGVTGEIYYRGPNVMKGYYGDAEKTAATIDEDGWLHSGDLGYFKNGELYTVDRKKECINTGGEKVFPLEVEEIIVEHPGVKEVCVIGVPDEDWGSTVRAIVIPEEGAKPTAQEIMDFCKGKMAGYKKPRSVVFVKEFPLNPVGKVLRQKIRELYGKPDQPQEA